MHNKIYLLAIFAAPAIAAFVTLILMSFMLRSSMFSSIQDVPNARSLHDQPIPRFGGLALMLGVLIGWHFVDKHNVAILFIPVFFLMLLSLLDDLGDLPAKWRLLVHLLIAIGFVWVAFDGLPFYGTVLLWLGLVWMTNLYNFMDGSNGLAGGMAVLGFGFYALAAYVQGDSYFALMSLVIVAPSLVFLAFNFGKAKVFMGDAGSIPLGFLAGAIGLLGWQKGLWPAWFPVMVFSNFIVDATATLFKRLLRGERVWEAHREHYYQRLIQMGWSHQKTALVEYLLMITFGSVALLAMNLAIPYVVFLLTVCILTILALMHFVDKRWQIE